MPWTNICENWKKLFKLWAHENINAEKNTENHEILNKESKAENIATRKTISSLMGATIQLEINKALVKSITGNGFINSTNHRAVITKTTKKIKYL